MGRTWGRLYTGTRNHRKISVLRRRHPDSWKNFYLLLELAFEIDDDGLIYLAPGTPYTMEDLAFEIYEDPKKLGSLLNSMEKLDIIEVNDQGIRFLSYGDRQFKSDSDAVERKRRSRERARSQQGHTDVTPESQQDENEVTPESQQEQDQGHNDVTPQNRTEQSRTETEQKQNRVLDRASSPSPDGGSDDAQPSFACKHFQISPEYFMTLLQDYPGLSEKILILELKKMRDWLDDNPNRHKRNAKGFLKNPKNFIRNWLAKVVIYPSQREAVEELEAEGRSPPDPNCPICKGSGWEAFEKDGLKFSRRCKCVGEVKNGKE